MIPTIVKATQVYNNSATLITNSLNSIFNCRNIISDISDHYTQFCITSIVKGKYQLAQKKSWRFSKSAVGSFMNDLEKIDFTREANSLEASPDVDMMFSLF